MSPKETTKFDNAVHGMVSPISRDSENKRNYYADNEAEDYKFQDSSKANKIKKGKGRHNRPVSEVRPYRQSRDKETYKNQNRDSPSSGHTSRQLTHGQKEGSTNQLKRYTSNQSNKNGGREDDWEKFSRISRCTSYKKQPVALDGISNNLKKLHTLQIGLKRQKSTKSIYDKQQQHDNFIDQQIPLSERNEAKSEHSFFRFNTNRNNSNQPNTDRDRRNKVEAESPIDPKKMKMRISVRDVGDEKTKSHYNRGRPLSGTKKKRQNSENNTRFILSRNITAAKSERMRSEKAIRKKNINENDFQNA